MTWGSAHNQVVEYSISKRRETVERELREALERAQESYRLAPPSEQEAAKTEVLKALKAFSRFVTGPLATLC
jgi:hypothetical protein